MQARAAQLSQSTRPALVGLFQLDPCPMDASAGNRHSGLTSRIVGNVMDQHTPASLGTRRKARNLNGLFAVLAVAVLAVPLSACNNASATAVQRPTFVRTQVVQPRPRRGAVTLTGAVQARFSADLSFRVSGRVRERLVDIGAHVDAGEVLARLDAAEQRADVDAANAAVTAAEAQLSVAKATFNRQNQLIATGYTTRVIFDQAQEGLRTAEGSLELAKAQLGTANDSLGYTELRAGASGLITARSLEVGQVVQPGQPVFSLAQDGERDAVFDFYETIFLGEFDGGPVSLTLVSNPNVQAIGHVREVSPVINPKSATIRVKVTIENPPKAMTLGSAIAGTATSKAATQIALPWTALMAAGSEPAIWVVDPTTKAAALRPVSIAYYEAGAVVLNGGLKPGERIVVDGGKLLSSGQSVVYEEDRS
jgi:membrane fusion protein, multidrug efflux system